MTDQTTPELFYLSYDSFLADVESVAIAVQQSGWQPDFLVGIGRGGLVPATFLSHRTGISLLSVDHSSKEPGFADELLVKLAARSVEGKQLLFVDDINDSGATIAYIRNALTQAGCDAANCKIAVLIDNVRSGERTDYHATVIDRSVDKRWFVFPWESVATKATLADEALEVPERLSLND